MGYKQRAKNKANRRSRIVPESGQNVAGQAKTALEDEAFFESVDRYAKATVDSAFQTDLSIKSTHMRDAVDKASAAAMAYFITDIVFKTPCGEEESIADYFTVHAHELGGPNLEEIATYLFRSKRAFVSVLESESLTACIAAGKARLLERWDNFVADVAALETDFESWGFSSTDNIFSPFEAAVETAVVTAVETVVETAVETAKDGPSMGTSSRAPFSSDDTSACTLCNLKLPEKCVGCGTCAGHLRYCSRCYAAYCTEACQSLDWKNHKKTCSKPKYPGMFVPLAANGVQLSRSLRRWDLLKANCQIREAVEPLLSPDHEFVLISMRGTTCDIEEETGEARVKKLEIYPSTTATLKKSFDGWMGETASLAPEAILDEPGLASVRDEFPRKAKVYRTLERWAKLAKRCPEGKRAVLVAQDAENWNESFFFTFV